MRDGLLALLCATVAASCSYDWAVPADAAADSAPVEASGGDGSKDATMDADVPPDGSMDAPADGALDAMESASLPACTPAQEMPVQQARASALVCNGVTPNPCVTTVTDECNCPVVVATTNQAEATYVSAIKTLKMTCIPLCPTGCGTAPSMGVCIVSDAGSGVLACFQR